MSMLTCVYIQYSDERNSRRTSCFGAKLQLTVAEPPNPSREQAICHTVSAPHQAPGQLTPRKQSPSRLYKTLTGSLTHKCSDFHMWRLSCRVHSDTCICAWLCKMRVQPGGSEKWEYRWVWEGRGHFPGQKELFDEMGGGADRGRRMKSMKRRQRWEREREKSCRAVKDCNHSSPSAAYLQTQWGIPRCSRAKAMRFFRLTQPYCTPAAAASGAL